MKRTLTFVDAANQKVELEITCENREKHPVRDWDTLKTVEDGGTFSICGQVAGNCGQCDSHIVPTPTQKKIIDFWNTYHLNSMRAGTKRQMEALDKIKDRLERKKICGYYRWELESRYLRFIGLLEDRGYKFGTDWLFRPYPKEELEQIIKEIEQEERERRIKLADDTELCVDDPADENAIIRFIEDKCDVGQSEAYIRLALARHCDLEVAEIPDIKESDYCEYLYTVQGTEYYAGTEDQLSDLAKERLTEDKSLWIEAIKANMLSTPYSVKSYSSYLPS